MGVVSFFGAHRSAAPDHAFIGDVLKQAYLATATGYWLDLKAREYGVVRKAAVKAAGQVVFRRNQPRNENYPIPAGSIVATGVDQGGTERKFFTTTQAVLPAGELEIADLFLAPTRRPCSGPDGRMPRSKRSGDQDSTCGSPAPNERWSMS